MPHESMQARAGEDHRSVVGRVVAALGWSTKRFRENHTHLGAEHLREQAGIVDHLLGKREEGRGLRR